MPGTAAPAPRGPVPTGALGPGSITLPLWVPPSPGSRTLSFHPPAPTLPSDQLRPSSSTLDPRSSTRHPQCPVSPLEPFWTRLWALSFWAVRRTGFGVGLPAMESWPCPWISGQEQIPYPFWKPGMATAATSRGCCRSSMRSYCMEAPSPRPGTQQVVNKYYLLLFSLLLLALLALLFHSCV